jgi:hypothetical protein
MGKDDYLQSEVNIIVTDLLNTQMQHIGGVADRAKCKDS